MLQPWDRQSNESDKAYAAFLLYRDLPTETRSIDAAYDARKGRQRKGLRKESRAPGCWLGWSRKYHWVRRVNAWDDHQESIRQQAREKAVAQSEIDWVKRRELIVELEYAVGVSFLQQARNRVKLGNLASVPGLAETGSRLARKAAKMPEVVEESPPDNLSDLFFATSGQLAAAVPDGAVPAMPEDVAAKPQLHRISSSATGSRSARQPGKVRPN